MWDPAQYALFAGHRGRPFADLLARVDATSPRLVVDLGCGDGPLTRGLAQRWPQARVVGIDSSPQMLAAARAGDVPARVEWLLERVETWDPDGLGTAIDVLVTNATLQWVPGHLDLIPRWLDVLAPGGWFAMQVPANYDAPSHRLMREVASRHPRATDLTPGLRRAAAVAEPAAYLELLSRPGLATDVWETTYLHVLDPEGTRRSPVLDWVRATGLRPVLDVLTDRDELAAFLEDYA
ncbi:MAG TPA: methyltransferase domain-containing protein, partial [Candidatus Lustribacter sp.]|nr:methyltransferase domain-containing protein [Candidatus Lustribacter sp.]